MSSYQVNCLPDIQDKRYLELGIYNGHNFRSVQAKEKVSVDSTFPADFQGTTDEFFAQLSPEEKFDVVYIDACHQAEFVVRDFNNALKHLSPGGVIFVHDLIPDTEELTAPHFCGDAFRVLAGILTGQKNEFTIFSQDSDYGLSVFVSPDRPILFDSNKIVSYKEFRKILKGHKLYSRSELQEIVGSIGHDLKKKLEVKPKNAKPKPKKHSSNRRSRVHRKSSSKKSSK